MKHYAERDHMEQGHHYMNHVSAMTTEGLHSKAAIAGELAHRDIVIEDLFGICWQLLSEVEAHTNPEKDILNKLLVEGAYRVLNKHGLSNHSPRWVDK